jgi:hypothetical protein
MGERWSSWADTLLMGGRWSSWADTLLMGGRWSSWAQTLLFEGDGRRLIGLGGDAVVERVFFGRGEERHRRGPLTLWVWAYKPVEPDSGTVT